MIKLLKSEFRKTRRRYVFITAILITAFGLVWSLHGRYNEIALRFGWMSFLYQLPLTNAIFMPLLSIIVSSRLCDIEHKGMMLKQLAVVTDKGKIYDAKLIYGLGMVVICCLINWFVTIAFGCIIGFYGDVPIRLYLLYLLFTVVPTIAVYIFQHTLSLLFRNQALAFFAGITGTFCGLFSMFLPQLPWLRRLFIWGYYGALQFVGLFGWTKEARYENAYFEVMGFDWLSFGVLIAAAILMYIIGRSLFCRKEV
ncbi:MAG: ABC transporter permease [bacterium]|nr:ABC transporter permease [bacterium]